ncbi:MAG: hypothetical protein Q9179_004801 [Wetmoreana sp. 5 TL-2023]
MWWFVINSMTAGGKTNRQIEKEEEEFVFVRLGIPPNLPDTIVFARGPSPGKGDGCFTTHNIPRGLPILVEPVLFSVIAPSDEAKVRQALGRLPQHQRDEFRQLSGPPRTQNPTDLQSFQTNSISNDPTGTRVEREGIFPQASRFNHSCVPNAYFAWGNGARSVTIYALDEISPGQEIFISYIHWSGTWTWARRRGELSYWGFNCDCRICQADRARSEERRRAMRQLQINIDGTVNRYDKQYLYYKSLLEYYDQEGLTYPQPAEIQGLAAQCALDISAQGGMDAASWAKKALTHAQQELELDIVANGRDSPVVRKSKTSARRMRQAQR